MIKASTILCWFFLTLAMFLSACPGKHKATEPGTDVTPVSIAGTIFAEAGSRVDSDVNDSSAPSFISNDTFDSAQALTGFPIGLSGYVNQAGQGEPGNSYDNGDLSDIYSFSDAAGGMTIRLTLPDDAVADVDLILWDQGDTSVPLATRASVSRSAVLTVPTAGAYFVEVRAVSGATSYRLMMGDPWTATPSSAAALAPEFVPGEMLVKLRGFQATSAAGAVFAADRGLRMSGAAAGAWVRMRITDRDRALSRLNIARSPAAAPAGSEGITRLKSDTLAIIAALRQEDDVVYAEPNYIRKALLVPDDPLFGYQWHHDLISVPQAWDETTGSPDVIVAVLDTGVLVSHPDLADKLVAGYDFVSDTTNAGDGDGVDPNPNDPGDSATGGSSFHGTHVAGIIGAALNNGLGVAGIGGDTMIMPVRVLGRTDGTSYDFIQGLRWAAGLSTDYVEVQAPAMPAGIINASFGGYGYSQAEQDAITEVNSAGVIVVAAAGNESTSENLYPAAYDGVISVSAVGADGLPAPYTNYGLNIDLAAPGGNYYTDVQPDGYIDGILSTLGTGPNADPNPTYGYYQGTSMASPCVAAVAALMKAVRPGMTPDEFTAYVESGSLSAAAPTFQHDDYFGYGLVDAYQAVLAAQSPPAALLSVSPRSLFLADDVASGALFARKIGDDTQPLTIDSVSSDAAWLTVAQSDTRGDGLGAYEVSLDRSQLAGGIHAAHIIFTASQNVVEIPVRVAVLADPRADLGQVYLSLITESDLAAGTVTQQLSLSAENGRYPFVFSNVPPGRYYLLCGTDIDNDLSLTDLGESVGGYPSMAQWATVRVDRNLQGLDFVAGFSQWAFLEPARTAMVSRIVP